tara:strand:- start:61 stop:324 length:264 start_codon:yes stop_codon:yes gene_type:complete
MSKLETKEDGLYIDNKRVIKGWESFSGWYWFAIEMENRDWNGAPLWFGFVQGFADEWGSFSEAELKSLGNKVWEIKPQDLPHAGRRD